MRSASIKFPGHPDKACDLVAEAIVDEYLRRDPETRISLSVCGGRGALFVSGEARSEADFDVSALAKRTLGSLGIMADMEPFVSIEPLKPESALFANWSESPVMVAGYATQETPEMLPRPVALAKRLAKALDEKRNADEQWFWLGPDAEAFVSDAGQGQDEVWLRVEHGAKDVAQAREMIADLVRGMSPDARIRINELGSMEARGLGERVGASGRDVSPYGLPLPPVYRGSGFDLRRPEKAGCWLARSVARELVKRGARAVLVQVAYPPGEILPGVFQARDERGKDLSAEIRRDSLSLERAMKEWYRSGLCSDAARWSFAGEPGLPWED